MTWMATAAGASPVVVDFAMPRPPHQNPVAQGEWRPLVVRAPAGPSGGHAPPRRWGATTRGGAAAATAAAAAIAALPLLAAARRARGLGRRAEKRRPRDVLLAARGVQVEELPTQLDDIDQEVLALQREAERLRASAAELEALQAEQQLLERRRWFRIFDADGSGGVDAAEMQRGMKEFNGTRLDLGHAVQLVEAHDANRNGVLEFEEFNLPHLQGTLEHLRAEERAREEAARREEEERQAKLALEQEMRDYYASLPGPNTDLGPLTRAASAMAYLLPLTDSLRFGLPLAMVFPQLVPLLSILLVPLQTMNAIPFGQLLIFIVMQVVAGNEEVPALLRYNLRQAVVLDVFLFLPNMIAFLASAVSNSNDAPGEVALFFNAMVFFPLLACAVYSMAASLLGIPARGIPKVSEAAEMAMGMIPPHRRRGDR